MLPSDPVAWGLLEQLGVAPRDRNAVLAARPDPHEQPGLWLALEQNLSDALNNMGEPPPRFVSWQPPATGVGRAARHLSVWTFLATLPYVRKYHALHEVPDEISWETLGFLGAAMRSYRERTGLSGVGLSGGLALTARGVSYRLGRLAFDRHVAVNPGSAMDAAAASHKTSLRVHIPAASGRLDPDACDRAFAEARLFFPDRFPEHITSFSCRSWLMDAQVGDCLPHDSNIRRFQQRFTAFTDVETADWSPLDHIFQIRPVAQELLDELPQVTTLQRAVVAHLRAGRHWYLRTGWVPFELAR